MLCRDGSGEDEAGEDWEGLEEPPQALQQRVHPADHSPLSSRAESDIEHRMSSMVCFRFNV